MLGHWVATRVSLVGQDGGYVRTEPLPVLAVTEVQCLAHARDCTPNKSPRGIAVVGIGFGREGDAQSQSTPDKNPLLNIVWRDRTFRPGYILTAKGIRMGLAPSDSARPFLRVKLQRTANGDDWQGAPACISINRKTPAACGSILIDTGVQDMFMTNPPDAGRQCERNVSGRNGDLHQARHGQLLQFHDRAGSGCCATQDLSARFTRPRVRQHKRTAAEPLRYSLRCGRRLFWRAVAAAQANQD